MSTRRCGFGVPESELSEHDRAELAKFRQWLAVEKARKEGADPAACDLLEQAIYPSHVGREPDGGAEA